MKKWFMITAGIICFLVVSFISIICFYKIEPEIKFKSPAKILAFNKSIVATNANGYTDINAEYGKILEQLKNMTTLTVFEKLKNGNELKNKVYQEDEDFSVTDISTIKGNNVVVELQYDKMQDLVVYVGKNTRVVSYYWLMVVIPVSKPYSYVNLYFSTTPDESDHSSSYLENDVLKIYSKTHQIVKFIKSL